MGDINSFDAGQDRCKSGIKWYEYRKGHEHLVTYKNREDWYRMWLLRMYDSGKVKDTEGMI